MIAFTDAASLSDLYPTLLHRGMEVFQSPDVMRYLESLSAFDSDVPLKKLTDKICQSVQVGQRRHRGLRPFDPGDAALLEAITRGEFTVTALLAARNVTPKLLAAA